MSKNDKNDVVWEVYSYGNNAIVANFHNFLNEQVNLPEKQIDEEKKETIEALKMLILHTRIEKSKLSKAIKTYHDQKIILKSTQHPTFQVGCGPEITMYKGYSETV